MTAELSAAASAGSLGVLANPCPLIGIKPTHSRVSDYPASSFGTNSHVGPIGGTAADVATMMNVIAHRTGADPYRSAAICQSCCNSGRLLRSAVGTTSEAPASR
jgi:Asp-tRNA(Asn)/Glu-tRNA(Gln) amidotransferase A subunit family amidase